jgi:hypothetical protein
MTNSSEPDQMLTKECQEEMADSGREVRRTCYALGGAHGPLRKAAKADLKEALHRLQRIAERDRDLHSRQKQVG